MIIGTETHDVERKITSILKILRESQEPLGGRVIAGRLRDFGVELTERAVRYHLKIMDERGLTQLTGRDGRVITQSGREELENALVRDKVGFVITRIETLAYQTGFDIKRKTGSVPVNVSFFTKDKFNKVIQLMRPAFDKGICASRLVAVADEGEKIGDIIVPPDKVALATVCSIIVNSALLKAGVPMDSRFGGILEIKDGKPLRFVELLQYAGSSLDPSEVFIRARMTSVRQVAESGSGKILANYRETPALCRPVVEEVAAGLEQAGMGSIMVLGNPSEPVCEIPVDLNRVGIILLGGLNPVAAAYESGIAIESHAMSTLVQYEEFVDFNKVLRR